LPYKVIDGKIEPLTFTADEVIQKLKDEKIKFLNPQFTVMNGRFHHATIAANMFRKEDFKVDLPKIVLQFVFLRKFMSVISNY
jgi:glutamine synthetase